MNEDDKLINDLRLFFCEIDSLLSLLAHRHGSYLDKINERETAIRLYQQARDYTTALDFSVLSPSQRKSVLGFVQFLKDRGRTP